MPSYKLTYFNARARTEVVRLIFAAAGVEYEDNRIAREDWGQLKPNTPQGTLPVLEIDGGKKISQAQAIARYIARENNLAGSTNLEMLEAESVMELCVDIFNNLIKVFPEKDEAKKMQMAKEIYEEKVIPKFKYLEAILNGSGGEYFVGGKLTMADIHLFAIAEFKIIQVVTADPLKDFPKLKALNDRVAKQPGIAKYLAKRPVTPF